jgi:hypothetical protein
VRSCLVVVFRIAGEAVLTMCGSVGTQQ